MSEVAGHLWACMNVYSIAPKRAIPKTFAICFPCFSKLTRLSRPDSNVFLLERKSYSSNTSWRKWMWRLKGGGHRWACICCRSLRTGRPLNKDPGYEVRNMTHEMLSTCKWALLALSCKIGHNSFRERRWKFCWFVNLQHDMSLKTRWRQHSDGFTWLMARTHGSWRFSGCCERRNHTEQVSKILGATVSRNRGRPVTRLEISTAGIHPLRTSGEV